MATRTGPVSTFKHQHAAFIFDLRMQVRLLRANPQAGEELAENMRELVGSVHQLKDAFMARAVDARGNADVLAKPYWFYSHNLPLICNDIVACLLHWADTLVNTDGQRTDGILACLLTGCMPL
ncbi:hypothetical protein N7463_006417 [Penicillium fimorum]|uniref:Uncharacterized protein n=1 Tax=Penicillium fimorum TaxID=1882269 RepID=A0A9W9XUB7_9EURO|nr:hypothetical protein N7463_006417 [Penicillium fimorum]